MVTYLIGMGFIFAVMIVGSVLGLLLGMIITSGGDSE